MLKSKSLTFGSILATTAMLLSGCAAAEPTPALEKIVITGVPTTDDIAIEDRFGHLADVIAEATGLEVGFFEAPDYAAVTEAIASGRAHIAHMDAFSYIAATNRNSELVLIAGSGRGPGQKPGYLSYGITLNDSDVNSLEDLRGKSICYSDPASTASFIWPNAELAKIGIDGNPLTSKDVTGLFTGSLPTVAQGVANGDCEVGFLNDGTFDILLPAQDAIDTSNLRVFWQSEEIPGVPLVAHQSIPAETLKVIQAAVLERANKSWMVENGMCAKESECLYLTASAWGYVPNSDSNYDVMRELCVAAKIEGCQ